MNQRPGTVALRILVVVFATLLGAAVADRVMGFAQKHYVATVTLQVRSGDVSNPEMVMRVETARELILSRQVLEPVTKSLALRGTEPVSALRRAISIKEIRDTELVQISVTAPSPVEAARQANAVAEEFQRTRMDALQKQTTLLLEALQTEVDAQRAKVKALKVAADKIRIEAGITDLNPDGLEQLATAAEPKRETSEKHEAAKQEYLRQKKILEDAEMKLATGNMETKMPRSPVVIWERAEPPATPDPRPRIMLTLGGLLGVLVGVGLAFLPRPGITTGIVLVLLGVASFPRWSAPVPAPKPFTPRISVGGNVVSPQLLDYAEDLTVLRAIVAAGGFSPYAHEKRVHLLRDGKVIVVDVTTIRSDPSKDIPLQPGDSIQVPQSFW